MKCLIALTLIVVATQARADDPFSPRFCNLEVYAPVNEADLDRWKKLGFRVGRNALKELGLKRTARIAGGVAFAYKVYEKLTDGQRKPIPFRPEPIERTLLLVPCHFPGVQQEKSPSAPVDTTPKTALDAAME